MGMNIIELLTYAVTNDASDLHLSSGLEPLVRIDGDLMSVPNEPVIENEKLRKMLEETIPEERFRELVERFEVDLSLTVPGLEARFRVNIFFQLRGISAAFRVIPIEIQTLEQLGMPPVVTDLTKLANGIILVTGPTGSGKSTTLAAMINEINQTKNCHIVTIEDPVEFIHKSQRSLIQQREVHQHTRSFANALRAVLREDPDVILVGEMRDLETIRLAMTAAETGHLVLATLHTSSSSKTINRVIDVFPSGEKDLIRTMLSESLQAVISQRLLRKKGGGRIAAQEIMICNLAIRNLIRENKLPQIESVIQTSKAAQMQTMEDSIKGLVSANIVDTSIAEQLFLG